MPELAAHKLTVVIPVYNQIELCRECLQNLSIQTLKDFRVILLDDCSSQDYRSLIGEFPGLSIDYIKNEKNLGAIINIFHSIFFPVSTEYIMSLHEDDLLHPQYLELAIRELDEHKDSVFAGSNGIFFDRLTDISNQLKSEIVTQAENLSAENFVRFLLAGNPFVLASVVYRAGALAGAGQPDIKGLSVACDRPFLTEMVGSQKALLFNKPMFFIRRHGKRDMRWKDLDWRQAFKLFVYYRGKLQHQIANDDRKLFYTNSTNNLLLTYRSLFPNKRPSVWEYIRWGRQEDLIQLRYIDRKGLFGLLSMVIGSQASFYLLKLRQQLQKIFQTK